MSDEAHQHCSKPTLVRLNDAVAITQLCVVKRRRFLDDYERSRGAEKTIAEIGIATDDRRPTTGDRLEKGLAQSGKRWEVEGSIVVEARECQRHRRRGQQSLASEALFHGLALLFQDGASSTLFCRHLHRLPYSPYREVYGAFECVTLEQSCLIVKFTVASSFTTEMILKGFLLWIKRDLGPWGPLVL
ncbi:hypothetical protein CK203_071578 [Vitis vinifera]|uniref:Uncharacterized protein n=1 Tax=Vitis vinifera TaxID=29760 RepID=A0A438F4A7_VITVI|nr:hypothetical protein CK203_071578 [Vitis vinifera]